MEDNTLLDTNLEESQWDYEYASTGQRFANYLVDQIIMVVAAIGIDLFRSVNTFGESSGAFDFAGIFIGWIIALVYYTLMEGSTGKTVGKYVTGTRALTDDGEPLDMGKAFVRSLCRLIPFDAFSFLFGARGWHDSISKTMVVRDR